MLMLADILEAIVGERYERADHVITDAVIDSRHAIPGSLFIALQGQRVDGHDFVLDAFQRGASVAIIEHSVSESCQVLDLRGGSITGHDENFELPICLYVENTVETLQRIASFWRRKFDLTVIGITGSVGKSTTKELIAEVLSHHFYTLKNPGNLNNEIGLPLTMLRLTPGHQMAILEMGFYIPGEIKFLCDISRPQIGVITNVGTVHAERAGSQEKIAQGKAELVQSLPSDGVAILNHDDPLVRSMADQTDAEVLFYGLTSQADLWADEIVGHGLEGIYFRLHYGSEDFHLKVPMIGTHSVHTALRTAAVALVVGMNWQDIITGLKFGHTQLRLIAVRAESGALLLDDTYNASPQSALAALNLLNELEGRKVAVLGDMLELGSYEKQGHEMVGIRAAEVADEIIVIGKRGRLIAEAAINSGFDPHLVSQFEACAGAIDYMRERLSEKDVALVKGSRGMHMDIIVPSLEVRS
jgi:UDP-N-acetylmuramoyl-tripeptide--D-alanyl-D-alanine ligase